MLRLRSRVKFLAKLFALQLLVVLMLPVSMVHAQAPVFLGAAASFAVLAGSEI